MVWEAIINMARFCPDSVIVHILGDISDEQSLIWLNVEKENCPDFAANFIDFAEKNYEDDLLSTTHR